MKRFCVFLLSVLTAGSLVAAELRVADATKSGDAPIRQLALKTAFADPSVQVSYARRSVKEALAALAAGKTDLVAVDVPAIPKKFEGARKVYAVRALVFYVNSANTLEAATRDQLRDIFSEAAPTWGSYSFLTSKIKRYGVKPGKPGAAMMEEFLAPAKLTDQVELLNATNGVVLMTEAEASAIGFGLYLPSAPVQVRMLAVDGVAPTLKSVASAAYPLAVKRAVLTAKTPGKAVAEFLKAMDGADFRDLVEDAGMMPVDR